MQNGFFFILVSFSLFLNFYTYYEKKLFMLRTVIYVLCIIYKVYNMFKVFKN